MTTPIDSMAAVKLLREALQGVIRVADRKTDEFDVAHDAIAATASIEQPASEAVEARNIAFEEAAMRCNLHAKAQASMHQQNEMYVADFLARTIREMKSAPPPLPLPLAKEAILQALVDHDQALGLYDDGVQTDVPSLKDKP